jgi:hypothetical protein
MVHLRHLDPGAIGYDNAGWHVGHPPSCRHLSAVGGAKWVSEQASRCSVGRETPNARSQAVRDAEVAGSNPAHPTFAQLKGPVILSTRPGYVAISALPLVGSQDMGGERCPPRALLGAAVVHRFQAVFFLPFYPDQAGRSWPVTGTHRRIFLMRRSRVGVSPPRRPTPASSRSQTSCRRPRSRGRM